eukprot:TRINITY_DN30635_c0_g1_i1.p1 TRINITY_DN30635_c0_g1~~TRINITY_DN30635_c0_g1_i1.p1  ORF type:complete len:461 (+),score=57.18 TRINITY_DN30635_c0_g1_i1:66-1448(+)
MRCCALLITCARLSRASVDFGDLNGNRPDTPGIISSHSFHLASEMFHNSEKAMSEGRVTSKEVREATGFKKFVVSPTFDSLSAALLTLNAIFIGIQVEFEFDGSTPGYIYAIDYMFCVLFVVELVMRFVGFGCRRFWCGQDRYWNWFDFFIVTLSTIDAFISIIVQGQATPLGNISILRIIRIVRITRVLRIIRVMKVFKDLRVLLAAIGSTIKTAVYAFVLIFCAMWMFGVALTQLAAEYTVDKRRIGIVIRHDDDLMFYFGSLGGSLMTLFMTISGGIDWKDAAMPLFEVNPLGIVIYLVYTLLMVLCVMNVLTGIFCQAAIETAQLDRDNVIQFQLMEKQRYIETLKSLFYSLDESGDGKCSLEEFQTHLSEVKMEALLRSLDIEVRDALTLFELFDTDGTGYIDLEEFVTGCITLRGGAKAVHMEKISSSNRNLHAKLAHVDEKVDKVMGQLKSKA